MRSMFIFLSSQIIFTLELLEVMRLWTCPPPPIHICECTTMTNAKFLYFFFCLAIDHYQFHAHYAHNTLTFTNRAQNSCCGPLENISVLKTNFDRFDRIQRVLTVVNVVRVQRSSVLSNSNINSKQQTMNRCKSITISKINIFFKHFNQFFYRFVCKNSIKLFNDCL